MPYSNNSDDTDDLDVVEQPRGGPAGGGSIRPSKRAFVIGGAAALVVLGGGAVAIAAAPTGSGASGSSYGAPLGYGYGSTNAPTRTPHLAGTVKSVSGTKILITDHDGFTRTINTSSATKYTDGLTAAPAVGTEIHAEGTVNSDGVSLNATTIGQGGPAGGGRGPGRHGGPGGPGGNPKPTGTPPSGAPSTTTPAPTPS